MDNPANVVNSKMSQNSTTSYWHASFKNFKLNTELKKIWVLFSLLEQYFIAVNLILFERLFTTQSLVAHFLGRCIYGLLVVIY